MVSHHNVPVQYLIANCLSIKWDEIKEEERVDIPLEHSRNLHNDDSEGEEGSDDDEW